MKSTNAMAILLGTLRFAAERHRDQRRKGAEASPYINHLIEVAELLAREGNVTDLITLQAAVLHDTLEDTQTTAAELTAMFGSEVCQIVEEMTDDNRLSKTERKRLQVDHAGELSARAKVIKLADKISNILGILHTPPAGWSLERRREYLDWSRQVIAGCRGYNTALEKLYDKIFTEGRRALETLEAP